MDVLKSIFENRRLIKSLAYNDFKTKYAGSQFGIIWAFVQPVVTILIYVFVFQVMSGAAPTDNGYPYVLWLIAGLVPWFYFSEAITSGTTCLVEYSYLVKKVMFNISILPVIKVLSALFVHLFFVGFSIVIFILAGKMPTLYYLQIVYYMICMIVLSTALSYIASAILPFFKDFSQVVNIILMVGMWVCPIMWNLNLCPEQYHWILRLNPIFYIVQGYRDSMIDGIGIWERPVAFAYFWIVTLILLVIGIKMFKKLSVHFSDVL